jgi:hypothetical protein
MEAPFLTMVGRSFASRLQERGCWSLVKVTFGPTKTSSSKVTPSQKLDAALHRDTVADEDLVLDEAMGADVSVAADDGPGQDYHRTARPACPRRSASTARQN